MLVPCAVNHELVTSVKTLPLLLRRAFCCFVQTVHENLRCHFGWTNLDAG